MLIRSNEPNPLSIGTITRFDFSKGFYYNNKINYSSILPIIKFEDNKEYLCFAIIKHYDVELMNKLNTMPSIEQYNYLANPHCQLKEKYGVKYKTYNN